MKFFSVLKAIAAKAAQVVGVAGKVAPIVGSFLPAKVSGFLGVAVGAVAKAEEVAARHATYRSAA